MGADAAGRVRRTRLGGARPGTSPPMTPSEAAPALFGGRYRSTGLLGRGGMADVHRAHDERLVRDVAVKVLRPGPGLDRDRFAAEAEVLAELRHPGIVALLDAGLDDELPWLALELVEGRTLREIMADGPPAPDLAADLGAQVAEALAAAHECGIIHRDVKPANVLVDADGRARIADFGIARLADATSGLTLTGQTIGTAAYLAPEQVGGADVGTAVDVYALGLVLLEWFTGRKEYDGSPLEAAVARLQRQPTIPASLPPGWARVVQAMTARDPQERPSAVEAAALLRALGDPGTVPAMPPVDGTALLTLPPDPSPAPRHAAARRRGPLLAGLAAAAALTLIVLAGTWGGGDPVPAVEDTATPTEVAGEVASDMISVAWTPPAEETGPAETADRTPVATNGKAKGKSKGRGKGRR